jgi:adenylate cyclase, class 2
MIEVELKARLDFPDEVRARLRNNCSPEKATYHDMYLDLGSGGLEAAGQELRIRTVKTVAGICHVLTCKGSPVGGSGSKPEWETRVGSSEVIRQILAQLGYRPTITLTKHCENYRFNYQSRQIIATLVTVPELSGTFLEVETQAEPMDLDGALATVRMVFVELGVTEREFTDELYTTSVGAARQGQPSGWHDNAGVDPR